ncbi:oligosaccharyl transferase, archaeosortase A system-associated [Salinilacihabitans rarus]|uniref:oligosaccharyl transferase, archaeosortase A system-associated n=1 Tax=Salinilacihabitans rarus TaxID=2961596 RepID=UPI0020C86072|nr:oligosaccharyl transferase, archaeosortase A system-associated [Salinilacihabitans rarus]
MSTDTEHVEEGAETSTLRAWERWYHLPVLGAVMLFMLWVRTQQYERFLTDDGTPALAGVDSWYHWRMIRWTAENYPSTMPYEAWTGFPTGRYVGQFGTLFDQLIVTAAMIVGLGDPSTGTVYAVALFAIPVMAALVAVPVFYAGRRLGGTFGGLVSVVVLALAPGQFLSRSTIGQLDHHVGEVLFMAIAVFATMVAVRVGERDRPIYELVAEREWDAVRRPALYAALAGLALALYVWVWPSAVVLVGIFGVFYAVALSIDYLRGVSPDHLAFVGAVSMAVTALVAVVLFEEPSTSPTSFGYLQVLLPALVAVGSLFMAWLARQWNARDLDRRYYPVAIAGLAAVAFAAMAVVLPDLFDTIANNLTRRLLPLGEPTTDVTIREAQRPDDFTAHAVAEFGAAFYTMLAGLALLAARPLLGREYRAEYTLVIVWSLFLISMAATQIRFAYYLVLAVAVVNAAFVADVANLFDIDVRGSLDSLRSVETYQIIVVALVVLLLFAPLLPPLAQAGGTAWAQGNATAPNSDARVWEGSNEWLNENTPEPGNWAGADGAAELDYYGTYERPADGDYDYPEGTYGVLSWWDYGHLITVQGERIPHSNPFQQNARSSSAYLTAESEERGELILDAIAAGASVSEQSNEELSGIVEGNESDEEIRYVMIDYATAGGKFGAITQWTGPAYGHYATPEDYQLGEPIPVDEINETLTDLPYDDTMTSRLYFGDATGMENYRLVHENAEAGSPLFASYAVVRDGQVALDENGRPAVAVNRQVSRGELLQLDNDPRFEVFDVRQAAAVKTFERVEGATITGTVDDSSVADANATVFASVELATADNRTFTYVQEAAVADDGSFELTVPYATDDELAVEDGYTNSSVEATGPYDVELAVEGEDGLELAYDGTTEVGETAVVEGQTVDVTLEEATGEPGGADAGETDGDGDDGTQDDAQDGGNDTQAGDAGESEN